jgi:hypothetical protein
VPLASSKMNTATGVSRSGPGLTPSAATVWAIWRSDPQVDHVARDLGEIVVVHAVDDLHHSPGDIAHLMNVQPWAFAPPRSPQRHR